MTGKIKRKIIVIDEENCTGCGECITACPEGALQLFDTPGGPKARVVKESFCDGLGACIGDCPEDALFIEEHEVDAYDEEGVIAHMEEHAPEIVEKHRQHMKEHAAELAGKPAHHGPHGPHKGMSACPGAAMQCWDSEEDRGGNGDRSKKEEDKAPRQASALRQWPVQLHLVPPQAPYFKNADLVLTAACVPFSYPDFHRDFLKGKAIAIACPKLDNVEPYVTKLRQIIELSNIKSLTVVIMEVPCCSGLAGLAGEAIRQSNRDIPLKTIVIGIRGDVLAREGAGDERAHV